MDRCSSITTPSAQGHAGTRLPITTAHVQGKNVISEVPAEILVREMLFSFSPARPGNGNRVREIRIIPRSRMFQPGLGHHAPPTIHDYRSMCADPFSIINSNAKIFVYYSESENVDFKMFQFEFFVTLRAIDLCRLAPHGSSSS